MQFDIYHLDECSSSLVTNLKSIVIRNVKCFQSDKTHNNVKFHSIFCLLYEYLDVGIEPFLIEILVHVHEFDVSPTEKGNGYRSLIRVVQKCCFKLMQISRHISVNNGSLLFRKDFYLKELEAYVGMLGQLRACLFYAHKLLAYSPEGCLFVDDGIVSDSFAEKLMTDVELLSRACFYGRCLGFQVFHLLKYAFLC